MEEEREKALRDVILETIGAEPDAVEKVELRIVWRPSKENPKQS